MGLYAQKGERQKVVNLIERQLAVVGGAKEMTIAREVLIDLDVREAHALADKQQFDAALPILRKALADTTVPERKAFLEVRIPEMEAAATHYREAAIYDEAVQLVRKGKLSGAAAKLRDLVKVCKDPDVCPVAKRSLRELNGAGARP